MTSKLLTIGYLISLATTLWMTYRHSLRTGNDTLLKKVLVILLTGYLLAVTYLFAGIFHFSKPLLFLFMLSFGPFVWLLLTRSRYEGNLSILVLAVLLSSLGLVVLFRLDFSSKWILVKTVGYGGGVPVVLKQLLYTVIALTGVVIGVERGVFAWLLRAIVRVKKTVLWGILAFLILALPKLIGLGVWHSQDKSIQVTEAVFKIVFLIFVSKYYESRSSDLILMRYPKTEVLRSIGFILSGIVLFFFVPMFFFQKELGTVLLIGLSFVILTAYVMGRISFFFIGLLLMGLAIGTGVLLSSHVEQRVIGGWWNWKEFAFKPFREGNKLFPGYQIFMAIASIRLSLWGVGLGNGIVKYHDMPLVPNATHDFIAAPLASELGILSIFIVVLGYFTFLDKAIPKGTSLTFESTLATGIAVVLATQGLYNLSGVIALVPATGIPLPFISYGGSAVFANYFLVGLLLTILNNRKDCYEK